MAHLITGYAGHAHIKSADEGSFNASLFGGGQYVMNSGQCLEASIIDNNTIRIHDGDGLMYGRHFRVERNTYEDLTIESGTAGVNRIDMIVMTYEKNDDNETEEVHLEVIRGVEGVTTIPEYTDGSSHILSMTVQRGEAAAKFGEITGTIPASYSITVNFKGWAILVSKK